MEVEAFPSVEEGPVFPQTGIGLFLAVTTMPKWSTWICHGGFDLLVHFRLSQICATSSALKC